MEHCLNVPLTYRFLAHTDGAPVLSDCVALHRHYVAELLKDYQSLFINKRTLSEHPLC